MDILGLGKRAVAGRPAATAGTAVAGKQSIGNEWIHAGTSVRRGLGGDLAPVGWTPPSGADAFGEYDFDVGNSRGAVNGFLAVLAGLAVAGAVALAVFTAQRGPS